MFVFDTSAYMNGRRDHFRPSFVPTLWAIVEVAIVDGRIVLPREVYRELTFYDDELADWIKTLAGHVVEPSQPVQRRAGEFEQHFPKSAARNRADPFILAEAEARQFAVVTYEGRTFRGVPTTNWTRTMPDVCQRFGIPLHAS